MRGLGRKTQLTAGYSRSVIEEAVRVLFRCASRRHPGKKSHCDRLCAFYANFMHFRQFERPHFTKTLILLLHFEVERVKGIESWL